MCVSVGLVANTYIDSRQFLAPPRRGQPQSSGGPARNPSAAPIADRAFYTEHSLAAHLSVSGRLVRKWVHDGRLRSYKLGGCRRFDPADVVAFLEEHLDERGAA